MLIKRARTAVPVFRALVLSGCFAAGCAVGENAAVDSAVAGSGQSSAGSSASGTSGAAHAGTTGAAAAGSPSAAGNGDAGDGDAASAAGGAATGGAATGGAATGGSTGSAGNGGVSNGGAGNGGSATGGAGNGGVSNGGNAMGGAGNGGVGNGGSGTSGTAGTGGGTIANIDLSTVQPASAGTYNGTNHTLALLTQLYCQFPLPKTFTAGQSVAVHVTGTNNGSAGLRSWLVDSSQTTLSNMAVAYVGAGLPSGSFTMDYTLTATNSAGLLFYKGPTFDTNIDNVVISSITVTY